LGKLAGRRTGICTTEVMVLPPAHPPRFAVPFFVRASWRDNIAPGSLEQHRSGLASPVLAELDFHDKREWLLDNAGTDFRGPQ
jgi:hypothetical protein